MSTSVPQDIIKILNDSDSIDTKRKNFKNYRGNQKIKRESNPTSRQTTSNFLWNLSSNELYLEEGEALMTNKRPLKTVLIEKYLSSQEEKETQISKTTQCEQDTYEMQVRAANIVRAGESLMKLVSDIKQYSITSNSQLFRATQIECDKKLMKLRDEMAMYLGI